MNKQRLIELGWTPEKLKTMIAGCRDNARAFRQYPKTSRFTYRFLNARLYRGYKSDLFTILN